MKRSEWLTWCAVLAAPGYFVMSSVASAQQLDEVLVTAERRTTDLQDTPVAITAVTAEDMQNLVVVDTRELAAFVPNLTMAPAYGYGMSIPVTSMRGVGAGSEPTWGIANDPSVATYIDGMYYGRNPGSILQLSEIQSVEVLRGPQGTLFGRNTTGGAIVYHTYQASLDGFSGYVDVGIGNMSERNFKAGINVPLSDTWAMRVAYADLNRDGFMKRGDMDFDNINGRAGRLAFHGEPTDRLSLDASLFYTSSDTNGSAGDFTDFEIFDDGPGVGRMLLALQTALVAAGEPPLTSRDPRLLRDDWTLPPYCLVDSDGDAHKIGPECSNYRKFTMSVGTIKATYNVNDHVSFSASTGLLHANSHVLSGGMITGTWQRYLDQNPESYQQEILLNLTYDRWNAVAGMIHYAEDATEGELQLEADIRPGYDLEAEKARVVANIPIVRRNEHYGQHTRSNAVFGQATFSATKKLDVTAGLRYTRDSKEGWIRYTPTPVFDERGAFVMGDRSWAATDGKLSFQYHVTDDLMLYLSGTKAYRAGVMNDGSLEQTLGTNNPQLFFTDPEDVVSTEVGIRSEWFDKRLQFNSTYFNMTWGNRTGVDGAVIDGIALLFAVNEPNVTTTGVEVSTAFAVTDALTLTGTYSTNETRQKDNPDFRLSGNAPTKWSLRMTHSWKMASGATLASSLNYAWTGEIRTFNITEGDAVQPGAQWDVNPAYAFTSGRVTYTPASGDWSLALVGQNLLDKNITLGGWSNTYYGAIGAMSAQKYRAAPRSIGVNFRYNF